MKFFIVGFNFKGQPKVKELEGAFDAAEDWVRYAQDGWIIYTDRSSQWWADHLNKQIAEDDGFVMFQIDPSTRWGYHQKFLWEWLDKKR